MQLELWSLTMKLLTFVGVVAAAMGMVASLSATRWQLRFFVLGIVGVALMVLNVWLAAYWYGVALDASFAFVSVYALTRAVQEVPRGERVGSVAGAGQSP